MADLNAKAAKDAAVRDAKVVVKAKSADDGTADIAAVRGAADIAAVRGAADIAVIGMAVMGKNLAFNIESRGYTVAIYNRTTAVMEKILEEEGGRKLVGCSTLEELVGALKKPRKVIIMVKAGAPVDATIDALIPLMDKDDIIIDAGNSFYKDTIARNEKVKAAGLRYVGTGVSGGEEGALKGPAIMPGCDADTYAEVEDVLCAISAKVDNTPCCTYIGKDGAGHFVKMVHNGIEYADMQLICEAYSILKDVAHLSYREIVKVFEEWNKGELESYLIEITGKVLAEKDDVTGNPMVEMIVDKAGQKGTGRWTSESALEYGVAAPAIAEAVFARAVSAIKKERVEASKIIKVNVANRNAGNSANSCNTGNDCDMPRFELVEKVRRALYSAKICAYAQGFALMQAASDENGWDLKLGDISMIFRGGCIIRAKFLQKIKDAYDADPNLKNLLLDDYFNNCIGEYQPAWREVVAEAVMSGVPTPAFSSSLNYFDSYRSEVLPANVLQGQRDFFGAHTFERTDKPEGEFFHHIWEA